MANKSLKKILAVTLLSTIGLVACDDEVKIKTANYDNPLIALTESEDEIYHNLVSIIEDAYRDGSLASATLDKLLYTYSVSVFGRYNRVAKPYNLGSDEITLKEAVKEIAVDVDGNVTGPAESHANVDAFIENHKAYWTTNNKGERVAAEERGNTEYARVYAKWKTIEDRIARSFYGDISSSYTNDKGYFSEEKFLRELRGQMHDVLNPYDKSATGPTMTDEDDKIVVTSEVQEEEVFTKEVDSARAPGAKTTYLHRENYQDAASYSLASSETLEGAKAKYVEDEIIPSIYRTLLVEQYLFDKSYNNLGRSAARKVNVLSLSANSNNDKAADYLSKYFVRNVISYTDGTTLNDVDIDDFKVISNAMVGLVDSGTGKNATLDAVNTAFPGAFPYDSTNQFYTGTDYGDMMASYIKIKDDANATDPSAESDFTGSYTHTKEVGKEIKTNEIRKHDYVTDGWFVKSNSVGDLPDSIKNSLFNIGVANVLDDKTIEDRFQKDAEDHWTYTVPASESKLVAKINGKYYLKISSKESGANPVDDILFSESGKYYVIQIEEAVSGSKLAKETTNAKYDETTKEQIINEVARVVANNDTYQSASTKYWLEQVAIKYHDTKVYDYFKENYPDLF